ncbi:MAG: glycosyltransferase [Pseudomonadota bacterium]|nr:glycosyltransferase [Pseudomonadota bacterium]
MASRIAVLIPCYNEAEAIEGVVKDFAAALPSATIYVYDNNSTDETKIRAARAGAIVRVETFQGKGNVVRRMFADIEAEAYVLVDGDGTYDAASAAVMVDTLLANSLDMVNGSRVPVSTMAFRPGHVFGNKLLTGTVAAIFGNRIKDMLSGYRVFSRRFVKSFPALASGFETETELTVHALELRLPLAEIQTPYRDRPPGSKSKLNTFRDGFRILRTIVYLVKEERPMQFFSLLALLLFAGSIILGWPVIVTYIETGLVPRLPTAVLAVGTMILAAVSFIAGSASPYRG